MKRIFSILLVCGILSVSLCSCSVIDKLLGKGTEEDTAADTEQTQTETETDTEVETVPEEQEIVPDGAKLRTLKLSGNISGVHVFGKRVYVNRNYLSCDYSGSGMEFVVDCLGGSLKIATRTTAACRFLVTLDGKTYTFNNQSFVTVNGSEDIVLKNLPAGKHTVRIIKLTGFEQAQASFFSLSFYGTLLTKEVLAEQETYVEFLGGNAASGLGAAGDYTDQDATKAYPYLLANKIGAEYSIFAMKDTDLLKQMTGAYPYANVKKDAETAYDFPLKASLTVIHIGSEGQNGESFKNGYKSLIQNVLEMNGKSTRVLCVYNTSDTTAANVIPALCEELGGNTARIFCVGISVKDSGVLTEAEQQAVADAVEPAIRSALEYVAETDGLKVEEEGNADIRIDYDDPSWNK